MLDALRAGKGWGSFCAPVVPPEASAGRNLSAEVGWGVYTEMSTLKIQEAPGPWFAFCAACALIGVYWGRERL